MRNWLSINRWLFPTLTAAYRRLSGECAFHHVNPLKALNESFQITAASCAGLGEQLWSLKRRESEREKKRAQKRRGRWRKDSCDNLKTLPRKLQ